MHERQFGARIAPSNPECEKPISIGIPEPSDDALNAERVFFRARDNRIVIICRIILFYTLY